MVATLLIGGICLFIYSIDLMSKNLEYLSQEKIKRRLTSATKSTGRGLFMGFISMAIIQSSSAVTILTISLINARLLSFENSIALVLGSNIATTITSFLVGINIENVSSVIMLFGVILMFSKKDRVHLAGRLILAIGLLFFSLYIMSLSILELKDSPVFYEYVQRVSDSFIISLVVGCLLTLVLQSSSLFVAILQVLAMAGFLSLKNAIPFIFGANIGTTFDSFFGIMHSKKEGKKLIHFHFYFNLLTVVFFSIFSNSFYKLVLVVISIASFNIKIQIAIANILFNILGVILVLPFLKQVKRYYARW